jgi:hypothetical protein
VQLKCNPTAQDVPLAGPLNRREIEDLEALVQANVVNVPYWLNLDRPATEGAHQAGPLHTPHNPADPPVARKRRLVTQPLNL